MRFSRIIVSGLILSCLLTLGACAPKTEKILFLPPIHLLGDIKRPQMEVRTQGDLLRYANELNNAIDLKNADMFVLREYYNNCLKELDK